MIKIKQAYLSDKMHPTQDILNQSKPDLIQGPCCQFLNTFLNCNFFYVHIFAKVS
jgi:hypothetical protein